MSRLSGVFLSATLLAACDEVADPSASTSIAFRDATVIDVSAPPANAPVVATLVPGAPFELAGRHAFAKAPGVGPNMSRFSPANVGSIPAIRSGDIVAVQRGGQLSRARIIGVQPNGAIVFRPQAGSPFVHAFDMVPWSAWNGAANAVHGCSDAIAEETAPCIDASGNHAFCTEAASDELDDCASGQDYSVSPSLGGVLDVDFECLLPPPYSMTSLGDPMSMGPCDGEFWGTVTQEPGDMGCEDVYDGTWVADDPDCNAGPADVIVLAGA
jgi:hypothetical protein